MTLKPTSADTTTATLQVVTFRLEEQRYGLPLDSVLQVARLPALTPVAGAPETMCGLLNLRGQFLPVLNGRVLIGAEPATSLDNYVLILAHDGRPALALLVDAAEAVRVFPVDGLVAVHQGAACIAGIFRDGDAGSAVLLDPAALQALASGAR